MERYANAMEEISGIIETLAGDEDLKSNIRASSPSAYEAAVDERLEARISDGIFDGTISGDAEKAEFYTELSNNKDIKRTMRNSIIKEIKDWLLAG